MTIVPSHRKFLPHIVLILVLGGGTMAWDHLGPSGVPGAIGLAVLALLLLGVTVHLIVLWARSDEVA